MLEPFVIYLRVMLTSALALRALVKKTKNSRFALDSIIFQL